MWEVPYVWALRLLMFEFFEHSYFGFVSDFVFTVPYDRLSSRAGGLTRLIKWS